MTGSWTARRVAGNLLLLLVAVISTLAGVEVLLRLGGHRVVLYDGAIYVPSSDRGMVYQLRPSYRASNWGGGRIELNELGFRERLAPPVKPPGVVRVVGLGDSFTFGNGVKPQETYLKVLERAIEAPRVETLNFGVPGYNTAQEVALLKHIAIGYHPDLILLGYVLNDHMEVLADIVRSLESPRKPSPWKGLFRSLHLYNAATLYYGRWLPSQTEGYGEAFYRDFDQQPGWPTTRRALHELAAAAKAPDIPVVVVIFPFLDRLRDYPLQAYHREVCRIALEEGMECVDLLDVMRAHQGDGLLLSHADPHPSARAYDLAGQAVAAFLRTNGLLKPGGRAASRR